MNNLIFSAFNIDANLLSSRDFISLEGEEGNCVYMLGFPMGLVQVDANTPICRMGCVARMDPAEISTSKQFLLDIQTFPGNSGSPVIAKPEFISTDGIPVLSKPALIGIVLGHIPYEEDLTSPQTGKTLETRSENSGLAFANPAEYIRDTVIEFISIWSH